MTPAVAFVVGMVIGAVIGAVVMAVMHVASNADDLAERDAHQVYDITERTRARR